MKTQWPCHFIYVQHIDCNLKVTQYNSILKCVCIFFKQILVSQTFLFLYLSIKTSERQTANIMFPWELTSDGVKSVLVLTNLVEFLVQTI